MAGTSEGGKKAAAKLLARDPDHYRKIAAKGGSACGFPKGFALMSPEKRRAAGAKGGSISRRKAKEAAEVAHA